MMLVGWDRAFSIIVVCELFQRKNRQVGLWATASGLNAVDDACL